MFLHAELVWDSQQTIFSRLARTCSAYPRLCFARSKAWMPTDRVRGLKAHGTRPAKDEIGGAISLPSSLREFPRTALRDAGEGLGACTSLSPSPACALSAHACVRLSGGASAMRQGVPSAARRVR